MDTIFLESSAVNYISEKGLSGEQFVDILEKKSLVPVIGRYTTLELAKDILHDKVEPVKKLFYFVKSLNSIFACRRDQLYKMEEHKLRNNLIVNWQTNQEDMKIINGMIDRFCKGQFNDDDRLAIKNREIFMDSNRQKNWSTPKDPKKSSILKGKDFETFITWFFQNITPSYIEYLINFFRSGTSVNFNKELMEDFISNIAKYPALRTFLYSNLYLDFIAQKNPDPPAKDKFPDCLQIIEGSYCTYFVSNDTWHINSGNRINPNVIFIRPGDLI